MPTATEGAFTGTAVPSLTVNGLTDTAIVLPYDAMLTLVWSDIPFIAAWPHGDCTGNPENYERGPAGENTSPIASWATWAGGLVFSLQGRASTTDQGSALTTCRTVSIESVPSATETGAVIISPTNTPAATTTAIPPTDGSFTINGTINTEIAISYTDQVTLEWGSPVSQILVYRGSGCTGNKVDIFFADDSPASYPGYVLEIVHGPVMSFVGTARFGLAGNLTTCRTLSIEEFPTITPSTTTTATATASSTVVPPTQAPASTTTPTGAAPTRTPSAPGTAAATAIVTVTPGQPTTGVTPSPAATSAVSTLPNTGTGDGPSADWPLLLVLMGAVLGAAGLLARRTRQR